MAKTNATNPSTGEMVLSAIKKLMKNTGWTTRTIVKFIRMEYGPNSPSNSRKISRALKKGVRLGLLQAESGRYRLNDMSRLARPVTARELRARPRDAQQGRRPRGRQQGERPRGRQQDARPRGRQQGVRLRSRSREPSSSPQNDRREPSPSPQRERREPSSSPQRDRRDRQR